MVRLAKEGDIVKVRYVGRLEDGSVFDSSGKESLQFRIGETPIFPGFEAAIVGMRPGEIKAVTVPADQAYGLRQEAMVIEVSRERLPFSPEIGDVLQIPLPSGRLMHAVVCDVSQSKVTLDGNHPLAGMDLTFDIQLVEIMQ